VILSDLNWDPHLRSISSEEVRNFELADLTKDRYERIRRYYEIIISEKADLVLFVGDLTGDGFCGHGFHHAFIILLQLLELDKTRSLFISGNHDPAKYYDQVLDWIVEFQYAQEISGSVVEIMGLKILGVNYDCSKSKRTFKKLIATHQNAVDIIMAHSQIKRRIMHFNLPAQYIFTGHYDRKLLAHRGIAFVALDNDSEEVSYAVLNKIEDQSDQLTIKIRQNARVTFSYSEQVEDLLKGNRNSILKVNNKPTFDLLKLENASDQSLSRDGDHYLYLKYLRGINYGSSLDTMHKMKNEMPLDRYDLTLNQIHGLPITASYQISESMIEDYLGNVID